MNSETNEFTKKEIIAGLFVVISVIILVIFILLARGFRPTTGTKIYYAKFKNTLGLDRGADVRYGGLKVGKVVDTFPDTEDPGQVCVKLAISPNIVLNQKCVASVEQVSITSGRHLEISTGEAKAPVIEEGGFIPSINKSGNIVDLPDLTGSIAKVERLLDDITDFLGMDKVRAAEASGTPRTRVGELPQQIDDTLGKGTEFIDELNGIVKEQKPQITEIVKNIGEIEKDTEKAVEQINMVIAENRESVRDSLSSVKGVLSKIQSLSENSADNLENILNNIEKITSNIDNLSSETKNWISKNKINIDQLILDLKETIRNLRLLSQTLSEQPQSILTGKIPGGKK